MAQRIQVLLIDDLDGGEAAGTVRFGLDGTARSAARTPRAGAAVDTAKVREWAKGQGIEVKDRGRVPAGVVEQYQTAAGA